MDLHKVLEILIQLKVMWDNIAQSLGETDDQEEIQLLEQQAIQIEVLIEGYEKLQKTIEKRIGQEQEEREIEKMIGTINFRTIRF